MQAMCTPNLKSVATNIPEICAKFLNLQVGHVLWIMTSLTYFCSAYHLRLTAFLRAKFNLDSFSHFEGYSVGSVNLNCRSRKLQGHVHFDLAFGCFQNCFS